MDLKEFQTGVATLARYTNQMKKDPDPFMLQVGKDGKVSLISGHAGGTAIWRTQVNSVNIGRYGIDSKLLSQGAKALKGKGVTVQFEVENERLVIRASTGGSISLKFVKLPVIIHRPPTGDLLGTIQIGNLDQFARKVMATDNTRYDGMVFEKREPDRILGKNNTVRVITTDGYLAYEADLVGTGDLPELSVVPIGFWNALRGATGHGEARFLESGLSVRLNNLEFCTGFVGGHVGYPSWWDNMFPRGHTFDVGFQAKRKDLLAILKKAVPLIRIEVNAKTAPAVGIYGVVSEEQINYHPLDYSKVKGTGSNELTNINLTKILSAFDGDDVIISWNKTDKPFYLIRQADTYHECFILAPVVRPNAE